MIEVIYALLIFFAGIMLGYSIGKKDGERKNKETKGYVYKK